jgi:hypothetical protein
MGAVSPLEWDLQSMRDSNRMRRLLHPPDCEFLVASVARHAQENDGDIHFCWETAAENTGYQRIIAEIPVKIETFDALFNGRTGYRAQYYLSPEQGAECNRTLVKALIEPITRTLKMIGFAVPLEIARASMLGRWSRIWVARDGEVFSAALQREFRPKRWARVNPGDSMALRAPLPERPTIDLKGTRIRPQDGAQWLSPDKANRDQRLHERGYI